MIYELYIQFLNSLYGSYSSLYTQYINDIAFILTLIMVFLVAITPVYLVLRFIYAIPKELKRERKKWRE